MPVYFLVLESKEFEEQLRPALAASWRQRSFAPCRMVCQRLASAAQAFAAKYHTGPDDSLLARVAEGLNFDPRYWPALVGEMLLYAAVEIPELQTSPDSLACLLESPDRRIRSLDRATHSLIHQVHFGAADLVIGGRIYRPDKVGINDSRRVAELGQYLAAQDPASWCADDLKSLPELATEADRVDELAFVREWFPSLQDLYEQARLRERLIICEEL